jgi:YegS/Rv2252/BmrU family lipid kinase
LSIQFVHVVINPAAGQDTAVLHTLNRVFQESNVDWDVSITKQAGDAKKQAQEAVARGADVVAAYGGDGTVVEVMSGLVEHDVPLAILPGGTANAMAGELDVPADLAQACQMACGIGSRMKRIDAGRVNERLFMLRVATGLEAAMVESTQRAAKTRFGTWAYLWSALQQIVDLPVARYSMTLDGQEEVVEGLTCMVANSGQIGRTGLSILPTIDITDGLLDVLVVQHANAQTLFQLLGSIAGIAPVEQEPDTTEFESLRTTFQQSLHYWQVREVQISMDPPQTVQSDGEILDTQSVHCTVLPQAVPVLVPVGKG